MKHHSTKSVQRLSALRRLLLNFESLEDRRMLAVDVPPPPLDSEPPQVLDTSFMAPGALLAGTASIDVTFSESVIGADNVANYELRRAGADGLLLSSDPVTHPTSITINNNTATLILPKAIGKDTYRLTIKASITDIAGNVLQGTDPSVQGEDWRSDFVGSGIVVPPIQMASTDRLGTQGNQLSRNASISSDGRYVAFQSFSSNLVTNDTNGFADVFVKDTVTGAIARVSTDSFGNESNGESSVSSISADGRYVAFQSSAKNLVAGDTNNSQDVFIKDLRTGTTIRVSTDSQGLQGNNTSFEPSISADGRYVAFQSFASNLVAGDTNRFWDVFVKDLTTGCSCELPPIASVSKCSAIPLIQ